MLKLDMNHAILTATKEGQLYLVPTKIAMLNMAIGLTVEEAVEVPGSFCAVLQVACGCGSPKCKVIGQIIAITWGTNPAQRWKWLPSGALRTDFCTHAQAKAMCEPKGTIQ